MIKSIYPLRLRQIINNRLPTQLRVQTIQNVPLEFGKGLVMDITKEDVAHREISQLGFYELALSKAISALAHNNGGVMLDVGANYGYFSLLWVNAQAKNKAYCFEASPLNIAPLKNNIYINNLQSRIKLEDYALGKNIGTMLFALKTELGQTGWGGLMTQESSIGESLVEVKVETIDNYCKINKIDFVDVLKIDVEGADTWVIQGAENMLKQKKIGTIFFEQNTSRMDKLRIATSEVHDFLTKYGYSITQIAPGEYMAKK